MIIAGTPLSYWAGDNPMRYAGGLLGGSWLTALTSTRWQRIERAKNAEIDLANGRFA